MFEPGRVAALGVSVGDLVGSGSPRTVSNAAGWTAP